MTIVLLLRRIALQGALLLAATAGLSGAACYGSPVDVAPRRDVDGVGLSESEARTGCVPHGGGSANTASQGADRSTVVGVLAMLDCFTDSVTMRWTEADGVVAISDSPDRTATDASTSDAADGSLLLGYSSTEAGIQAYLYDRKHGVRSLRDVLAGRYDLGLDLAGATLDGLADQTEHAHHRTALAPTQRRAAVRAWITTVPEPSTFALLAAALVSAAATKRWKRRRA